MIKSFVTDQYSSEAKNKTTVQMKRKKEQSHHFLQFEFGKIKHLKIILCFLSRNYVRDWSSHDFPCQQRFFELSHTFIHRYRLKQGFDPLYYVPMSFDHFRPTICPMNAQKI